MDFKNIEDKTQFYTIEKIERTISSIVQILLLGVLVIVFILFGFVKNSSKKFDFSEVIILTIFGDH